MQASSKKVVTESSQHTDKAAPKKSVSPEVSEANPLWRSLATHVSNNVLAGAGAVEPSSKQRMCEECDEDLKTDADVPIQTKLTVGAADDPMEREADAVAEQVISNSEPIIQRKNDMATVKNTNKNSSIDRNHSTATPDSHPELVHNSANQKSSATEEFSPPTTGGQLLNSSSRKFFERRIGYDFNRVRIHNDNSGYQSAKDLGAKAYTSGNHIVFGEGQYSPGTREGDRLIAHELAHVVQQNESLASSNIQRDEESAEEFIADAWVYWADNVRPTLRNSLHSTGGEIARTATYRVANLVNDVVQPFEDDLETDQFAYNFFTDLAGGAANLTRTEASGSDRTGGGRGVNIASRIVNIGINIMGTVLPQIANYRAVGDLKSAAIRTLGMATDEALQASSSSYIDFENDALTELEENWGQFVSGGAAQLRNPSLITAVLSPWALMSAEMESLVDRSRREFGPSGSGGQQMLSAINSSMQPGLDVLRDELESAQSWRELSMAGAAVGAGVAGGATIGAGAGLLGGPFAEVTVPGGALLGGAIGLVGGLLTGAAILWD